MQSKRLFRWKMRAIDLGSSPCLGHKLKLFWCSCPSSHLCSWHNCYSFRHHQVWLAALAPRDAAHGYKGRGYCQWWGLTWRIKGNLKGEDKKEGRTQSSHRFWQYEKPVSFYCPGLFLKWATSTLRQSCISDFWQWRTFLCASVTSRPYIISADSHWLLTQQSEWVKSYFKHSCDHD